jgi:hypothetical protein
MANHVVRLARSGGYADSSFDMHDEWFRIQKVSLCAQSEFFTHAIMNFKVSGIVDSET